MPRKSNPPFSKYLDTALFLLITGRMINSFRRARTSAQVTIALSIAVSLPVFGQTPVILGSEIPQMRVRVCGTLEDARKEAALALRFGQDPYRDGALGGLRNKDCDSVLAAVIPLKEEQSISPFSAWTMSYDELSSSTIPAPAFGKNTKIKVGVKKGIVRYYFGTITLDDGEKLEGWFEMPDSPYILSYLEQKKRPQIVSSLSGVPDRVVSGASSSPKLTPTSYRPTSTNSVIKSD